MELVAGKHDGVYTDQQATKKEIEKWAKDNAETLQKLAAVMEIEPQCEGAGMFYHTWIELENGETRALNLQLWKEGEILLNWWEKGEYNDGELIIKY